jgi:T4 bacteriophage base plate protein
MQQLPKLETPKYTVTIPSINKTIEFRPYLVKEEKILMIAMESEDEKQIISAVKEIVRACTFDKINPDDLSTVDLEYIFLKLRAKSVGENAHVQLKCQTKDCSGLVDTEINLDSIQPISINPSVSNKIKITDKVGMTLRPVTVRSMSRANIGSDRSKADQITGLIIASLESIYDEKNVYRVEDYSIEDLTAFVDSLSTLHLQKVQEYLESLPRLSKEVEYFCPKCKCKQKFTLTGIQSFFA